MSVDTSGLIAAIDDYAVQKWDCVGEQLRTIGETEAPKASSNMAGSVQWTGAGGGGGSVVGMLHVGADYAWFTTQEELHGNPVMVFESGGQTVFARVVHPSHPSWWDDTLAAFPEAISGCG